GRFLRGGANRLDDLFEFVLRAVYAFGRRPQPLRVDIGQPAHGRRFGGVLGAVGEVTLREPHDASGSVQSDLTVSDQVDVASTVGELVGHVVGAVDVEDGGAAGYRLGDREATTAVLRQLGGDTREVGSQGADQCVDQLLTLDGADSGDDREPRVQ